MLSSFLIYLAEVSVGLGAFALAYQLLFRRLTHFQWNRGYLVGSLLLSISIPLLPLQVPLSSLGLTASPVADSFRLNLEGLGGVASGGGLPTNGDTTTGNSLPYYSIGLLLLGGYFMGCLYRTWRLLQNLHSVYRLIRNNHQIRKEGYTLIQTPENGAPFSFLHYIFLNGDIKELSEEEQAQVLQHEQVHVAQRHTLDLLLFELAGIFFWFHPAVHYLGRQIREVHEYQVDAALTRSSSNVRGYGALLLKLALQQPALPILNTFSSKQIVNRISMLTQPKSSPMQKLKFLLTLPVLALTMLLCAFTGNRDQATTPVSANGTSAAATSTAPAAVPILKITWSGNKAYTTDQLNKALGIRKGDAYNKEDFNNRLNYNPDGTDVSSLYMDNGYLFFSVQPKEVFVKDGVELEMIVDEGPQTTIGQITVTGNTKVATAEMLEKINIGPGELFSRAKLIKAQQAIIQTGHFNPETIGINPVPNIEAGTVDIEFSVEEI